MKKQFDDNNIGFLLLMLFYGATERNINKILEILKDKEKEEKNDRK